MELRNLQTFNDADKFAIALGDNADLQTLIRFVDVQENIFIENKADRLIDALNTIMEISPITLQHLYIQMI